MMDGHPVEKPLVGIVFDVDIDIDKKATLEEACTLTKTFLSTR